MIQDQRTHFVILYENVVQDHYPAEEPYRKMAIRSAQMTARDLHAEIQLIRATFLASNGPLTGMGCPECKVHTREYIGPL